MTTQLSPATYPAWLKGGSLTCYAADVLPDLPVTAAFVLVTSNGALALTRVVKRGWDLPGGRLEVGEEARDAAVRETVEEVGLDVSEPARLVGFMQLSAPGQFERTSRYPDEALMAVYAADLPTRTSLVATLECDGADWVPLDEVEALVGDRSWLVFLPLVA